MSFTYDKLWILLKERQMKKKDLISKAKISKASLNKLVHNENVTTDLLYKICCSLNCKMDDIMELKDKEN